ncbi:MAG TPA: hypothetical protein VFA39_17385 [Steroidobacteraceae bacterium]|nr:hypothetical protein [Steroidobacteraceae bacterium]
MQKHIERAARRATILLFGLVVLPAAMPSRADMSVYGLYDLRHVTDPRDNSRNFPVVEMKGFFPQSFGSFLFKEEIDLAGSKGNQSQVYSELDQSIKISRAALPGAPLLLHLGYSGGLGVFNNATGGYYVQNAYSIGLEHGFRLAGAYCDFYAALRYTDAGRAGYDPMISFWVGKYFLGYKLLVANSLEAWTGADGTPGSGKFTSWELESEVWYTVAPHTSIGTYLRTTRNVYALSNRWLIYPSIGIRYTL